MEKNSNLSNNKKETYGSLFLNFKGKGMSERDEDIEFMESELMLQSHMVKHNQKRLLPTGECFWCKEKTEKESDIYCCVECGEDYERFKKANPHM